MHLKITLLCLLITVLVGCKSDDCWSKLDAIKANRDSGEIESAKQQLDELSSCLDNNGQEKGMKYYYHLGWVEHERQNYHSAISAYDKGLDYQPDYAFAYWRRGLANERLANTSAAEEDFRTTLEIGLETVPEFLKVLEQYPEIKQKLEPYIDQ